MKRASRSHEDCGISGAHRKHIGALRLTDCAPKTKAAREETPAGRATSYGAPRIATQKLRKVWGARQPGTWKTKNEGSPTPLLVRHRKFQCDRTGRVVLRRNREGVGTIASGLWRSF